MGERSRGGDQEEPSEEKEGQGKEEGWIEGGGGEGEWKSKERGGSTLQEGYMKGRKEGITRERGGRAGK